MQSLSFRVLYPLYSYIYKSTNYLQKNKSRRDAATSYKITRGRVLTASRRKETLAGRKITLLQTAGTDEGIRVRVCTAELVVEDHRLFTAALLQEE